LFDQPKWLEIALYRIFGGEDHEPLSKIK